MAELTDDRLREIVALAGKATPGPWLYRPYEHDDWGFVRGGTPDGDGMIWPVAIAKAGGHLTGDQYDGHRAAKTDPCGGNATFIAAADPATVTALASELLKLREAVRDIADASCGSFRDDVAKRALAVVYQRASNV